MPPPGTPVPQQDAVRAPKPVLLRPGDAPRGPTSTEMSVATEARDTPPAEVATVPPAAPAPAQTDAAPLRSAARVSALTTPLPNFLKRPPASRPQSAAAPPPRPTEIPWPDAFEPRPNFRRKREERAWSWMLLLPLGAVVAVAVTMIDPRAIRGFVDRRVLHRDPPSAAIDTVLLPAPFRSGAKVAPGAEDNAAPVTGPAPGSAPVPTAVPSAAPPDAPPPLPSPSPTTPPTAAAPATPVPQGDAAPALPQGQTTPAPVVASPDPMPIPSAATPDPNTAAAPTAAPRRYASPARDPPNRDPAHGRCSSRAGRRAQPGARDDPVSAQPAGRRG